MNTVSRTQGAYSIRRFLLSCYDDVILIDGNAGKPRCARSLHLILDHVRADPKSSSWCFSKLYTSFVKCEVYV